MTAAVADKIDAKAQIDFPCMAAGCRGNISFNLLDVLKKDFQVMCPSCHTPYEFDAQLRDKLCRMCDLIISIRRAEDILGNCNVSVNVAGGEVKIPYALLLTRLNTIITLQLGGKDVDFHLWVEPSSPETFR